jgi:hypothetical protein
VGSKSPVNCRKNPQEIAEKPSRRGAGATDAGPGDFKQNNGFSRFSTPPLSRQISRAYVRGPFLQLHAFGPPGEFPPGPGDAAHRGRGPGRHKYPNRANVVGSEPSLLRHPRLAQAGVYSLLHQCLKARITEPHRRANRAPLCDGVHLGFELQSVGNFDPRRI